MNTGEWIECTVFETSHGYAVNESNKNKNYNERLGNQLIGKRLFKPEPWCGEVLTLSDNKYGITSIWDDQKASVKLPPKGTLRLLLGFTEGQ